jgi:hypothetical protein
MEDINRKITKVCWNRTNIGLFDKPRRSTVFHRELNLQFGYPIVDLFELDMDWF